MDNSSLRMMMEGREVEEATKEEEKRRWVVGMVLEVVQIDHALEDPVVVGDRERERDGQRRK